MDADKACIATFNLETRLLTVTKTGAGEGKVTSIPAGIDCGADCEEPFPFGTEVTLIPAVEDGSVFYRWSGARSLDTRPQQE